MKRYIRTSSRLEYEFQPGDEVTVFERPGYSNYDAEFVKYEINHHGVQMAVIKTYEGLKRVHPSSIIHSEYDYFHSLTREDVLTKDFVAKLIHKEDSMFCRKVRYKRVDSNPGIENVTGLEADIISKGIDNYRVVITTYITKGYRETHEIEDKSNLTVDDQLIQDAIEIFKQVPEFYVNFAGYQRTFTK